MQTLPIKPIITNDRFIQATATIQLALWGLFSHYVYKGCPDSICTANLRKYIRISDGAWYQYRKEIIDIFQEITPEIRRIKKMTHARSVQCVRGRKESNQKRIKKADIKPLINEVESNPAPLVPQLSADSKALVQKRIVNEQHFTQSISPKPQPPKLTPGLIEKPKN